MTNAGLCGTCLNARIILNRRGSRFYFCKLSKVDPAFRKYPPLPVVTCSGYAMGVPETETIND